MSKKIKEVSAGIIFFTEDYELFMGRVTNSGLGGGPSRWDIPKGHIEEGETPMKQLFANVVKKPALLITTRVYWLT